MEKIVQKFHLVEDSDAADYMDYRDLSGNEKRVARVIAGVLAAAHRRETRKHLGLLAHPLEKFCDGVFRQTRSDNFNTLSRWRTR